MRDNINVSLYNKKVNKDIDYFAIEESIRNVLDMYAYLDYLDERFDSLLTAYNKHKNTLNRQCRDIIDHLENESALLSNVDSDSVQRLVLENKLLELENQSLKKQLNRKRNTKFNKLLASIKSKRK